MTVEILLSVVRSHLTCSTMGTSGFRVDGISLAKARDWLCFLSVAQSCGKPFFPAVVRYGR